VVKNNFQSNLVESNITAVTRGGTFNDKPDRRPPDKTHWPNAKISIFFFISYYQYKSVQVAINTSRIEIINTFKVFDFIKYRKSKFELISEPVCSLGTIYMIPSSARLLENISNLSFNLFVLSCLANNRFNYFQRMMKLVNLLFLFRVAILDLNRFREILFSCFLRSNNSLFSRKEFSRMTVVTVIKRKSKINLW